MGCREGNPDRARGRPTHRRAYPPPRHQPHRPGVGGPNPAIRMNTPRRSNSMKKALVGLAIAGVTALALSGCSDPSAGSGGDSAAPADWPAQDASLKGTTL